MSGRCSVRTLTLADEIVVLLLDDDVGDVALAERPVAIVAAIGGILMELALRLRIDTDPYRVFVLDDAATGDRLLDTVLHEIAAVDVPHPSTWWVDELAGRHSHILDQVMQRLVEAEILRQEQRRFLWVFSRRAYPQVSGRERREAKARLMGVLFADEVPEPRDTLLLGLANATGVLSRMLSDEEFGRAAGRIAQVANLEEIGRSVAQVCEQVLDALGMTTRNYPV